MADGRKLRQAVVIVHGMGEQRPLETLNNFIDAAIPGETTTKRGDRDPPYYSRPNPRNDAYEDRLYLVPARHGRSDDFVQTECYEYHWAHMMQGNKLADLWKTFWRMMLQLPWNAPAGLRGLWFVLWAAVIVAAAIMYWAGIPFGEATAANLIAAVFGGGLAGLFVTWLSTEVLPRKLTSHLIDVIRYLDTSPRSYAVRRQIRKGMVDLLKSLHEMQVTQDGEEYDRYQRIVVVAHSLGAYIAYDGISYLWTQMNQAHTDDTENPFDRTKLDALEGAAEPLLSEPSAHELPGFLSKFREAQRDLWVHMREYGNPWRVTDFVSVGTPMYMADQLWMRNEGAFNSRVGKCEIPSCPPQPDPGPPKQGKSLYAYQHRGATMLYHAAPFAVTRWSNMWFPTRLGFFGDWFAGPLAPLFGEGIKDAMLKGRGGFWPGIAHTKYFSSPKDVSDGTPTKTLRDFMDLNAKPWLRALQDKLDAQEAARKAAAKGEASGE